MNYTRIVVAAVIATLVDAIYGFLVWGMVLNGEFARYPAVYRPGGDMSALPLMLTGVLVAMFFASCIYAKGYEGRGGLAEGLRFGALMGLFVGAYNAGVNYGTLKIGRRMALTYGVGWIGEWLLVGIVIGLVYKTAARAAKSAAGV
jgi:hypothetical protein